MNRTKCKESLYIKNFAGIIKMTIEVKSMTILIGPQASGKSITAKLLYYFKSFFQEIHRSCEEGLDKRTLDKNFRNQFIEYFPRESWSKKGFEIVYTIENETISVVKTIDKPLKMTYSNGIKRLLSKCRSIVLAQRKLLEENPNTRFRYGPSKSSIEYNRYLREKLGVQASFNQLFIPAGRSFFANLQTTIFSFLSDNRSLDPFLIEFGSFYESYKRIYLRSSQNDSQKSEIPSKKKDINKLISEILNGDYVREKEEDYLVHKDKRKVNIINASSGQQETLPLLIIIKSLLTRRGPGFGSTLYIEEPEAHLFPTAQKKIIELLSTLFGYTGARFQFVITTHSPYNISALNNLIEAGMIREKAEGKQQILDKLEAIVPRNRHINPDCIVAYSLKSGSKKDLYDEESGLILADMLDEVSEEISIEFGDLLDIDFDEGN